MSRSTVLMSEKTNLALDNDSFSPLPPPSTGIGLRPPSSIGLSGTGRPPRLPSSTGLSGTGRSPRLPLSIGL